MQAGHLLSVTTDLVWATFVYCRAIVQTFTFATALDFLGPTSTAVDLVKVLVWPVVALSVAIVFRKPITLFLGALGSRITKLSLFKVELELVPATAATSTPFFDDLRTATNRAEISDSARSMLDQVQSRTPADFAEIAIGDGKEWLTSRLYVAAVMMQRMRGAKAFVFVERAPDTGRRLVAVAAISQLRWALARRYPWLEAAWAHVQVSMFPASVPQNAPVLAAGAQWLPETRKPIIPPPPPLIQSDTGALDPLLARLSAGSFIDLLQRQRPPVPGGNDFEWVTIRDTTQERATWVTRKLLESILPQEAFSAWAYTLRDAPRSQRTRAVLRRVGPFVALVETNREFVRLANRQALLEEIAASLGEEPEH